MMTRDEAKLFNAAIQKELASVTTYGGWNSAIARFCLNKVQLLKDQNTLGALDTETALSLIAPVMNDYPAYLARLDTIIQKHDIDQRRDLAKDHGAAVDMNHVSNGVLAANDPILIDKWWHEENRRKARVHLPDPLYQVYYSACAQFDYNDRFKANLQSGARQWKKQLPAHDPDHLDLDSLNAYVQELSCIFDDVMDPDGMLFTLSAQSMQRPDNYQSIGVYPVTYLHDLRADSTLLPIRQAERFCRKAMNNSATYDGDSDQIYLHMHCLNLHESLNGINAEKQTTHEYIQNLLNFNHKFRKDDTLYFSLFSNKDSLHDSVLHEKIHQYHFRCDAAFQKDPDLVNKKTGYAKHDAQITAFSNAAYTHYSRVFYRSNRLETLVNQTIAGSLYYDDQSAEQFAPVFVAPPSSPKAKNMPQ